MTDNDESSFDVRIEPPELIVEVSIGPNDSVSMELSYNLKDVLNIESKNIEIIDSHWHGIVLDTPEGTEHMDLRDVDELQ